MLEKGRAALLTSSYQAFMERAFRVYPACPWAPCPGAAVGALCNG